MNQMQITGSCVKIVGDMGKSFCEHGRKQIFRRILYLLSCEHPLCLSTNRLGMVRKELFTNTLQIPY